MFSSSKLPLANKFCEKEDEEDSSNEKMKKNLITLKTKCA
jgi:hypothetical protein